MIRLSKNFSFIQKQAFKEAKTPTKQFQRNAKVQTYSEKHAIPVYKTTATYNKNLAIKRTCGVFLIGGFTGVGCRDMLRLSFYSPSEYREVSKNDLLSIILRFLVGEKEREEPMGFTKATDEILTGTLGIDKKNFETRNGWWYGYILPALGVTTPFIVLALFFAFERRSLRNIIETVQILPKDPTAVSGSSVNDRVRITFLKSFDDYIRKTQRRYTVPLDDVNLSIAFNKDREEYWRLGISSAQGQSGMTPFVLPLLDKEDLYFDRKLAMKELKPRVIKSAHVESF